MKAKWVTCVALAAIALVGLWLRLHRLGDHSLWVDEAFSVNFAHTPWARFWKVSWSREGNMLLYYLLLRGWVHFAVTEFQLRLPSVIFGVAGVLMIFALGRELFSRATGLVAAALLAVHAFHVYYSQEARSYSLAVFLLITSAWFFARFVREPARRLYRIGYLASAVLAFYAHIFALLVIAAQWLAFFVHARRSEAEEGLKRGALLSSIRRFLLLALPMLVFAIFKNKGQLDWIPPLTPQVFMTGLIAMTGKGGAWLLALYLVLALVAVICALRSGNDKRKFGTALVLAWLLFPIAVFMLYSLHKPLFLDRYLVLLVPTAVLLAAEGIVALASLPSSLRLLWIPTLALLLALSFRATWRQYDAIKWMDWQTPTHFVASHLLPGDVLCFTAPGSESFFYYWQREGGFAWRDFPATYYQNGTLCTLPFAELGAPQGHTGTRVWLITTSATPEQSQWILKLLAPRFGPPRLKQSFAEPPLRLDVELLAGRDSNR